MKSNSFDPSSLSAEQINFFNSLTGEQRKNLHIHPTFDGFEIECVRASDIIPKQQPWFWPGIIPYHTSTLFAGLGGIGKSQLLLFLIGATSTGAPFQAGGFDHQLPQGNVIVLSAEDDINYQFAPKLIAADANLQNVYYMKTVKSHKSGRRTFIDLNEQLDLIELKLKEIGNVRLLVIDPISYFMGKAKDYINTEVSHFINGLNEMSKAFNLATIMNKHLRKQSTGSNVTEAVNEISGSGAWVNAPRQVLIIARDHEDPGLVLLTDLKSNIKKSDSKALCYYIKEKTCEQENGNIFKSTYLEWSSIQKSITANEALNKQDFDNSRTNEVVDFIFKYLSENGQSRFQAILESAIQSGIKEKTFYRGATVFEQNFKESLKIERGMKNAKLYRLDSD